MEGELGNGNRVQSETQQAVLGFEAHERHRPVPDFQDHLRDTGAVSVEGHLQGHETEPVVVGAAAVEPDSTLHRAAEEGKVV